MPAWPPGPHASATKVREALRAAGDRGRQAGRPAAEHDEVEALPVDVRPQAELAGHLGRRGVAQHAVVADQDRGLLARDVEPLEDLVGVGVEVDVVEAQRHQVALEEVADLEGAARARARR